jgi:hypothetical protein
MSGVRATGGCLCGAVRYEVRGALRNVVNCHCIECQRWHGNFGAYAAARAVDVVIEGAGVRWVVSPASDRGARRAFCGECGSSLFWQEPGGETISVAAGSLDRPTGLRTAGHWYTVQAGDFYDLPDDGLPRDDRRVTAVAR